MDIFCIAFAYYLGTALITDRVLNFEYYYVRRLSRTIITSVMVYQIIFQSTRRYKNIIRYEEGIDYIIYILLCLLSASIVSILDNIFSIGTASTKLNRDFLLHYY